MEKMIVVVFDNESKAVEGLEALWELEREGDISVYAEQIVAKEPGGAVRLIDDPDMASLPIDRRRHCVGRAGKGIPVRMNLST